MKKLCILEFESRNKNKYIFDGVTGTVFAVDDLIMDCIRELSSDKPISEVKEKLLKKYNEHYKVNSAVKFVYSYHKEKGAFYIDTKSELNNWRNSQQFETGAVKEIFASGHIQQIILNVTEDCNLRCKYCYLSEEYNFTRNRTQNKMKASIAIEALNEFFNNLIEIKQFNPGKKCAITFYGGEALMNFPVIYESIEYTKQNCPVTPIFNITTNGMLLKGDILDYLIDNNVNIAISLDGTKDNHDKNRVLPDDNGTYEAIMSNIYEIKRKYPNYSKISLMGVYDYKTNLKENVLFFNNNELPQMSFLTRVFDQNTNYYLNFTEEDKQRFITDYFELLHEYMDRKIKGLNISSYLEMLFEIPLISALIRIRCEDKKFPIMPYTSTCIPGMKISVRADGTYDMCEKVNSTFSIGSTGHGYQYDKIVGIIKKYNEFVADNCYECPINRQCSMCFAFCSGNGEFKKPNCMELINSYIMNLQIIYSILEENPSAYDKFKLKDEWVLNS